MKKYDVIIIGAGPGGIFSAYELLEKCPGMQIAVFEAGHELKKRRCPIDGVKVKACIGCKSCSIMSGFGGAGAFSDGKYNITNDFGGTLHEYIGKSEALELMRYVDEINMRYGGEGTRLYTTAGTRFKKECIQNDLHLLDASVRHLGTDINYVVLQNLYEAMRDRADFYFDTPVERITVNGGSYEVHCAAATYSAPICIVSVGRSGSKWMEGICRDLDIPTHSNRVDIGVRVELPAEVFSHLTDELYESKIVYRTEKYGDKVRTFCMNPRGAVVTENTNGIITVNGHSYEDPAKQTENTNFALLVAKHFSEPFKDSNGYGESIARLSNMLGGGVIVQRFGDLIRGHRSTQSRIDEAFPHSTRPYQHVLEPVFAYLMIAEAQYLDGSFAGYYNVGPDDCDCFKTGALVDLFCSVYGEGMKWENRYDGGPHEANFLKLDCSKLKSVFGWTPVWNLADAIENTVEWAKCMRDGGDVGACMDGQIEKFIERSSWINK